MNPRPDISYRQLFLALYERSGLKSELARITHGSPLREWRLGVVAAIVLPLGLIVVTAKRVVEAGYLARARTITLEDWVRRPRGQQFVENTCRLVSALL